MRPSPETSAYHADNPLEDRVLDLLEPAENVVCVVIPRTDAQAQRLMQAGVPTELHVHPSSYHAAETFAADAALSKRIWALRIDALQRALA